MQGVGKDTLAMIARVLVGKSHTSNPTAQHVIESRFHDTVYDCGHDNPYNESSLWLHRNGGPWWQSRSRPSVRFYQKMRDRLPYGFLIRLVDGPSAIVAQVVRPFAAEHSRDCGSARIRCQMVAKLNRG
jgi:hypothetical protein